jgi:hypothetical protein
MEPLLENLPPELLDGVYENLKYVDRVSLLQCSKHLHRRLEPILYETKNVRDRAMYSACKRGNNETIRLAISYGADVSVIEWGAVGGFKILTLQLAARNGNIETFSLLLELGAKINVLNPTELHHLMRRLSRRGNEALLRTFLKSELSKQINQRCRSNLPLVSTILRKAPFEVVEMLLHEGADPNRFERHKDARTPLSAAIMANSLPVFELLIQKGARMNFQDEEHFDHRGPFHVPIFAAALAIAKQRNTAFMQRCLDMGVNINYDVDFDWSFPAEARRLEWLCDCWKITPILLYLITINSFAPNPARLRPADGVRYLLDRGAEINVPDGDDPTSKFQRKTFSAVEIMLLKWRLKQLADPEFFALIRVLVEKGSGKSRTADILIQATKLNCLNPSYRCDPRVLAAWREFVQLLLKHRDNEQNTADLLLDRLLFDHRSDDPPYSGLRDLDRCTVECLVEAGATLKADTISSKLDWYQSLNRLLKEGEEPFGSYPGYGNKDTRPCAPVE